MNSTLEKQFQYTIKLPEVLDKELKQVMKNLNIDAAEAFRRALALFNMAIDADQINLVKDNKQQRVLIK